MLDGRVERAAAASDLSGVFMRSCPSSRSALFNLVLIFKILYYICSRIAFGCLGVVGGIELPYVQPVKGFFFVPPFHQDHLILGCICIFVEGSRLGRWDKWLGQFVASRFYFSIKFNLSFLWEGVESKVDVSDLSLISLVIPLFVL